MKRAFSALLCALTLAACAQSTPPQDAPEPGITITGTAEIGVSGTL